MKRSYSSSIEGGASSSREEVYDDELPNDREVTDPNAPHFPTDPSLPANCGRPYQWRKIIDGTLNFQQTLFLGRGSFGNVYRCHFTETNEDAAVKIQHRTGFHKEFLAEVMTLRAADHPNVIKLLGRCYGRRNRAIVYEFMPNGSLDRHILVNQMQGRGPQGLQQPTRVLDWDRRMKMALGVAQGLVYIHQVLKVVHRDVKAANILLDANFVPKLSDFGSATRIFVDQNGYEQQRHIYSKRGTTGYIAPETDQHRLVSTKSDVYSYGVFLFVLFTGRKVIDRQKSFIIIDWVMQLWNRLEYEPVDVALGNKYSVEGLKRIYHTARMCINLQPHARPAMRDVVTMVLQAAAFPVQEVQRRHSQ